MKKYSYHPMRHGHALSRKMARTGLWVSCALSAITIPGHVAAQETAEARTTTPDGIEDIVVTARRVEESLQTTPVAVSAFTGQMLEDRAIKDVTELSGSTPNLVLQASGANGSSKTPAIFLRGLGQADNVLTADPAVGLYLDGVYIARNTGAILDLVDLERVEILRGPQGTLFGKNTIGGAINLVSQKPVDRFAASAELTAGNYARIGGKAMINLPIGENLAARISGFVNRQDGYIDLVNYPGREFGDDMTWGARAQLRWSPSDNFTADLAFDYSSTRNTGAPAVLLDTYPSALTPTFYNILTGDPSCMTPAGQQSNMACFGPVQVSSDPRVSNAAFFSRSLDRVDPVNRFEVLGVNLALKWDISGSTTVSSISSYRRFRSDYSGDGGLVGGLFFQTSADQQDAEQYSQEIQIGGTVLDDKLKWLLGGYFFYEYTFSHVDVLSALAAAPFLGTTYPLLTDNEQPTHTYNVAAFGQATYDLTSWLHLTGGLRWTYEKKDALLILRPAAPQGLEGELTVKRVTPLVTLAADLAPGLFAYASYSEGFRSGGFPPRIIGQVSSIPTYGPEKAQSYEIGFKADLLSNKLRANVALFSTGYKDFQGPGTRTDLVPPFGTVINAGDARIKGIEMELVAAPSRYVRVDASLSHMDTRLTRADPTLNEEGIPVPVGKRLPFSPAWKASAGTSVTLPFADGSEIVLRGDVSLTDRIYFSLLNEREVSQESMVLVNAGATYRFANERLELGVSVKNATDSGYYTSIGRSRNTTGTLTGVLAPPRTWSATVRWRY
ncbi:TonB-dependent receptor [Sphingopyxis sp. NJF-3]